MLRVVAHQSAAAARQYYAEGLKREDYYSEGQEVVGKWYGKAAEKLGLSGDVTPDAFSALVDNVNPATGKRLTPRTNVDRRVGYDLNFHAPKSLSVLHALTGDDDIVKAFRSAVQETMRELEQRAGARVRGRGVSANRTTGNLAWAEFIHYTARPVGGIPDPHLHVHCFAFNATFDDVEGRWKAADFGAIKKDAPYGEAAFHARLTAKLAGIGYGIRRTKTAWEIEGIPQAVIDRFSRRTAQIERYAEEKGIRDAKAKDGLGAVTREGKRHGMTYADLLGAWGTRLTESEKGVISKVRYERGGQAPREKMSAAEAVDYAIEKFFDKNSVVEQRRLVAEALRYGVGHVTPEQVWRELSRREMVVGKVKDEVLCTSLDVLAEEVSFINFVRSGRGMCAPMKQGPIRFGNDGMSAQHKEAVKHILTSADQVIAVRGVAGAGKTTLMKEAAAQIEADGLRLFAFAPSAESSLQTLREAGFTGANTVAHLLVNKLLQKQTRGHVIWVDEAGLLGTREMWEVMQIAGGSTRVILTGDAAQHAPVPRGDAFRLLQKYAGLKIAEVTEIHRQERETYKEAVAALSCGDLTSAFARLDALGAIIEVADDAERYGLLAKDFMGLSGKDSVPLVVSPTHAEGFKVTEAIREARRAAGQLKDERSFTRYHNLQWENADKKRAENYHEGLVVQFHQHVKGIRRGEIFRVMGHDERGALYMKGADGRRIGVPIREAQRFQVFEEREIRIGKGERLRITRNGESSDGRRLFNGSVVTVAKFKKNGDIVLSNGATLGSWHGHFTYGYCQTSHSSQSKSVRDVLVAQSEDSFVASSQQQFYVSVSRGKQTIRIYTDNRSGLQAAVGNSAVRKSAVELAGLNKRDLSAMTSDEINKQWRDAVKSRLAEGQERSHVRNLLQARRQELQKKGPDMSWREYVEMRRGLVSADGRSRSKGHPQISEEKKGQGIARKGRSFARPTQFTAPTLERMKAAHAAKVRAGSRERKPTNQQSLAKPKAAAKKDPLTQARQNRLTKAYEGAARIFNQLRRQNQPGLAAKAPDKVQSAKTSLPGNGPAQRHQAQPAKPSLPAKQNTPDQQKSPEKAGMAGKAPEQGQQTQPPKAESPSKAPDQNQQAQPAKPGVIAKATEPSKAANEAVGKAPDTVAARSPAKPNAPAPGKDAQVARAAQQQRAQQAAPQAARPLPPNNNAQNAEHAMKQRADDAGRAVAQAAKVAHQVQAQQAKQAAAKAPAPPPPAPSK